MLKIKIIEEQHEEDCMEEVNRFLSTINDEDVHGIQFQCSHFESDDDQIYSFSVCIIYRD